jgi:restriction endonuclease Mrr
MSVVKLPGTTELRDALLRVLAESPDGLPTNVIDAAVAEKLNLTPEQLSVIRTGNRTEFSYRLAWERTHAKNKGLIEKTSSRTWKLATNPI